MTPKDQYKPYCFPDFDDDTCAAPSGTPRQRNLPSNEDGPGAVEAQAYESGYAQGREQALRREQAKAQPLATAMTTASQHIEEHRRRLHHRVQKDVSQLALTIAGKMIADEIRQHPEKYQNVLDEAIKMAIGQDNVKIKVHPDDVDRVAKRMTETHPDTELDEQMEIIADRNISRGGCLVETDHGVVDARIEQQLDTIESALEQAVPQSPTAANDAPDLMSSLQQMQHAVAEAAPIQSCGHVTQVVGLVVEANGPVVQLGSVCDIHGSEHDQTISAEVLGFRDRTVLMMPLEDIRSIGPGNRVVARSQKASVAVGNQLLGRVIDGLGKPIDGKGPLNTSDHYPLYTQPINPLLRQRIRMPLDMGVRAINGLLTVGCGQRIGIFAGSGVGKSVLMGMISRKSQVDVNVIALIGERGRELNEFIEKELGEEGLKKTVVVVATSDHLPLLRVRGAFVATAIAEYFRDQGLQVNLMMDSLTRFAMAQREIGLALGEPPTTKGYTPSVFTLLPKLLERVGTSDHEGTITGLYTVLVEGDDMNEPIADAARSILDGHIVLTRDLADQNHYPAIDVLKSISRVMEDIASLQHKHNAGRLKEMLATYRKAEDLINIGAYVTGSNPAIDQAIAKIGQINQFLRQGIQETVPLDDCLQQLDQIMNQPE